MKLGPWLIRVNNVFVTHGHFDHITSLPKIVRMNLRDEVEYPVEADLLILPYNGWEDNFPPLTMLLDLEPILAKYEGRVKEMRLGEIEEV